MLNCISSVYGHAKIEYTIKKSRFIASLQEAASEDEARACIEKLRKIYWDANHNCYAYQIGSTGTIQKLSDDGEPAGTAGRPILEVLKKSGITNTVIVVTRYFGGIKLGAGGLIRAYSHAAALGLDAAEISDHMPFDIADITIDYSFVSPIERLLHTYGVLVADRQFSDTVTYTLQIPQENMSNLHTAMMDATNGAVSFEKKSSITRPVIRTK